MIIILAIIIAVIAFIYFMLIAPSLKTKFSISISLIFIVVAIILAICSFITAEHNRNGNILNKGHCPTCSTPYELIDTIKTANFESLSYWYCNHCGKMVITHNYLVK